MGEPLLTTLSMENHHPSTLLSMDPAGAADDFDPDHHLTGPPDINLLPTSSWLPDWHPESCDLLDGLGTQIYDTDTMLTLPKTAAAATRKGAVAKRGDSIWGAWFFFTFYFKPVLAEKSKGKVTWDGTEVSGFDKADLRTDVFLVQHDMENMYMWVFKERPENALGKMQLRSYMNCHSRPGEPQFPFSVEKGFVRSHRMQRKQYRGLSNPQCVHGVDVVPLPNLATVAEADRKKWMELTGRELNFVVPQEASDYVSWRNLLNAEFELERPLPSLVKTSKKLLNGSGLNLSTQPSNGCDGMDLSPVSSKRRKDFFSHATDEDLGLPVNGFLDRVQDVDIHPVEPAWLNEFTGVMKHMYGPVTAAKTIYEDDEGYLIVVCLPFADKQRVKVSWRNHLTHGIVKIACVSTAMAPYIKRGDRTFKLTDATPEHCPPGEFIREIPLPNRIPEDAKLEAYYDESGTVLEIKVPKHLEGPEEHEVHVCMRPPHFGAGEFQLS